MLWQEWLEGLSTPNACQEEMCIRTAVVAQNNQPMSIWVGTDLSAVSILLAQQQ